MPQQAPQIPSYPGRIASLEALRGIAALVVVVWHTMLAFAPQTSGIFVQFPAQDAYTGSFLFVLMNGNGAVNVFFVLSGFVLSRRFFLDYDRSFIVKNALRRYPRLALPVLVSVIVSYLLFHFGSYHFFEAAKISGSPWLAKFGYAYDTPFQPSFWEALKQGAFLTFFRGDASYNSSLWTMKFELFGSFLIFGSCLLLAEVRALKRTMLIYLFVTIALMAWYASPWYIAFIAGLFIAATMPQGGWHIVDSLPVYAKGLLALLSLYLLGFSQAHGIYGVFGKANVIVINVIGSTILVTLLANVHMRGKFLSLAQFLGALSFPLYLIHIPILFSLVCWVYLKSVSIGIFALVWMIPFALIVSTIAALPLILINQHWLRFLNAKL